MPARVLLAALASGAALLPGSQAAQREFVVVKSYPDANCSGTPASRMSQQAGTCLPARPGAGSVLTTCFDGSVGYKMFSERGCTQASLQYNWSFSGCMDVTSFACATLDSAELSLYSDAECATQVGAALAFPLDFCDFVDDWSSKAWFSGDILRIAEYDGGDCSGGYNVTTETACGVCVPNEPGPDGFSDVAPYRKVTCPTMV